MEVLIWTPIIFLSRMIGIGLGMVRVQLIVRRKEILAALTGFVEVLIYILIVSRVINDIKQWLYVLAYAGGFATGTLVGMYLWERFSRHIIEATVICNGSREKVEAVVREAGYALTRYQGLGSRGCEPFSIPFRFSTPSFRI